MRGLANHAGLTLHLRLLVPGQRPPRHRGQLQGARARPRPSPWRRTRASPACPRPRAACERPRRRGARLRDEQPAQRHQGARAAGRRRARGPRARTRSAGADAVVLPGRRALRRGHAPHPRAAASTAPCATPPTRGAARARASASACSCCSRRARRAPARAGLGLLPGAGAAPAHRRASCPTSAGAASRWAPERAARPRAGDAGATSTYYFVHTYGCEPEDPAPGAGPRPTTASRSARRPGATGVMGVQFHPEKSSARRPRPARPLAGRASRAGAARSRRPRDHALPGHRPAGRPGGAPARRATSTSSTVFSEDPVAQARAFADEGATVAARGRPRRRPRGRARCTPPLVASIAAAFPGQVHLGGGLRIARGHRDGARHRRRPGRGRARPSLDDRDLLRLGHRPPGRPPGGRARRPRGQGGHPRLDPGHRPRRRRGRRPTWSRTGRAPPALHGHRPRRHAAAGPT